MLLRFLGGFTQVYDANFDNTVDSHKPALWSNRNMRNPGLIKKLLLAALSVFLTFAFIITLVNLPIFDEELSPEVTETLKQVKMPPVSENAFFAIWGLSASNNKNMVDTGSALITRYRENREQKNLDEITAEDYAEILGGANLDTSWEDEYEWCTARKKFGCAAKLASQLENKPIDNPRLILMLERYEQITQMSNYQHIDHLTFASPLPPYGMLMKLRRLKMANVLYSETSSKLIQRFKQDLIFWKMILKNRDTLIDKMVAVASIWSDLQILSEFLKTRSDISVNDLQLIDNMLSPLSPQELDISNAFEFEQQAFYNSLTSNNSELLESAFNLSSTPISWLIQPNATINDYQEYFVQPVNQLNDLSSKEFYKAINRTSCCFKELETLVSFSPTSFYNLGGKLILSKSLFGAQDYIARVHDLNGVISLVRLQLQIKKYPDRSIGELINHSEITNPYTGESLIYDKNDNWLGFECLNKGSFCKIKIDK